MFERSKILLLVALVVCAGLSHFAAGISPYYFDILIGIGINIILAVSLNLVNGYTGQFSLGHAGFMAVGAYASSWLTLSYGYKFGAGAVSTTTIYVLALIAGGAAQSISAHFRQREAWRSDPGTSLIGMSPPLQRPASK